MKRLGFWFKVLGVLAVLAGVASGWLWVRFIEPMRVHQENIRKATLIMSSYGKAEWKELCDECLLLNQSKPAWNEGDRKTWPKRFAELNPVYWHVETNDCVMLAFTGGFDEFGLYVTIYFAGAKRESGGPGYPGIQIFDDRGIIPKALCPSCQGSTVICRATSAEGEPAFVFKCVD